MNNATSSLQKRIERLEALATKKQAETTPRVLFVVPVKADSLPGERQVTPSCRVMLVKPQHVEVNEWLSQ